MLHADTPAPRKGSLGGRHGGQAASIRSQIAEDNQKVLYLKEQARKLKDVIKLNCVNDKQIQVKAEMNIADLADDQLQASLAKNGDDRQATFVQLTGAGEAVRRLREEAAACIGDVELFKQEQGGTYSSPISSDDPTQTNPLAGGEVEPPDSASY